MVDSLDMQLRRIVASLRFAGLEPRRDGDGFTIRLHLGERPFPLPGTPPLPAKFSGALEDVVASVAKLLARLDLEAAAMYGAGGI